MASIYKEIVILSSVFLEMDLFFAFQSESLLHRMLQNYSKQANNIFEQLTQSCEVLQTLFLLCNDFGNCISKLRRHFLCTLASNQRHGYNREQQINSILGNSAEWFIDQWNKWASCIISDPKNFWGNREYRILELKFISENKFFFL